MKGKLYVTCHSEGFLQMMYTGLFLFNLLLLHLRVLSNGMTTLMKKHRKLKSRMKNKE